MRGRRWLWSKAGKSWDMQARSGEPGGHQRRWWWTPSWWWSLLAIWPYALPGCSKQVKRRQDDLALQMLIRTSQIVAMFSRLSKDFLVVQLWLVSPMKKRRTNGCIPPSLKWLVAWCVEGKIFGKKVGQPHHGTIFRAQNILLGKLVYF